MAMSMSWSSNGLSLNYGGCQFVQDEDVEKAVNIAYLLLLEGGPVLWVLNDEALCCLGVRHLD